MSVSLAKNATESVYGTTNPVSLDKPVRLDKPNLKMVRRTWAQREWEKELRNNHLDAFALVLFSDQFETVGITT